MNKLTKLPPAWHEDARRLLADNFAKINSQFLDSTKKAVWLGIFLNEIKLRGKSDGSIPHGQFGNWLEANLPDVAVRQIQTYMRLATDVCEKGKFQIRDFRVFAHSGELPEPLLKIIEGKTQSQLFLEFKNVDKDGNPLGRGGAPGRARKLTTAEQSDKARAQALEDSGRMGYAVKSSNANFFLLTADNDLELDAQISVLEFALKLRRLWSRTPKAKRDAKVIEAMIQAESPLK